VYGKVQGSMPKKLTEPLRVDGFRAVVAKEGRNACTELLAVGHFVGPGNEDFSLVEVRLHTGRLHQIRAHLSHAQHPLVGDLLYGGGSSSWCNRIFLHAHGLQVKVGSCNPVCIHVLLPSDLQEALDVLRPADPNSATLMQKWLQ